MFIIKETISETIKASERIDADEFWKKHCDWDLAEAEKNPNILVVMFLTCSFLYYHFGHLRPIASDAAFDQCCKKLITEWDKIDHMHKDLITFGDLKAGTGYAIPLARYPSRVGTVALSMSFKRHVRWRKPD